MWDISWCLIVERLWTIHNILCHDLSSARVCWFLTACCLVVVVVVVVVILPLQALDLTVSCVLIDLATFSCSSDVAVSPGTVSCFGSLFWYILCTWSVHCCLYCLILSLRLKIPGAFLMAAYISRPLRDTPSTDLISLACVRLRTLASLSHCRVGLTVPLSFYKLSTECVIWPSCLMFPFILHHDKADYHVSLSVKYVWPKTSLTQLSWSLSIWLLSVSKNLWL